MKIIIMCELPQRELQFLTILKTKLEILGHEVELISQRLPHILNILKFSPDIIIVNGLRSYSSYINQIFIPKTLLKCKVISLYSEQVGRIEGLANSYNNDYILKSVDKHIVWGKKFAHGLQQMGIESNDIYITGSMSLDLIHIFGERRKDNRIITSNRYNLYNHKKWILISDNIIRKGDQKETYDTLRASFDRKLLKIVSNFPDCEFIFRPHPDNEVEDLAIVQSRLGQFANVHIIQEEHSAYWISVVDTVIVWRSTSSIEAWAADIPAFGLKTTNDWEYWWENLMEGYEDENQLCVALSEVLYGQRKVEVMESRQEYMNSWFYKNDGMAINRVARVIDSIKSNPINMPYKEVKKAVLVYYFCLEYVNLLNKLIRGKKRFFQVKENQEKQALVGISLGLNVPSFKFKSTDDGILMYRL